MLLNERQTDSKQHYRDHTMSEHIRLLTKSHRHHHDVMGNRFVMNRIICDIRSTSSAKESINREESHVDLTIVSAESIAEHRTA